MSGPRDCLLLVADPGDGETTLVSEALSRRSSKVVWIDTADFPANISMAATPGGSHPGWLLAGDTIINLENVRGIYRRSPGVFTLDDSMTAPERRFALMEAIQGVGGLFASLQCTWVNHPSKVADASYKLLQIDVARACDLSVPATLVTNIGQEARSFVARFDGRVIYKPMSPGVVAEQGRVKVLNATIVSEDVIDDVSVSKTAHTFQQFIEKRHDARVTVIGKTLFGVAIEAHTEESYVDWRADYDALEYREVDIPADVRVGIGRYMSRLGLSFAAFDFSVDLAGKWWFLEANPNGLWAWLEERVKIPVADAIAHYLSQEGTT